jgi:ABC-2 type transport system ATP-binding protein
VFGFLGQRSRKTTTIRLLLDLIRPTGGRLSVFGLDSRRDSVAIRRRLGYLPGDLRLYEQMTGRELLRFFEHLRGVRDMARADDLAARLDLDLSRRIKELSRGNRQKVGLVQAFIPARDGRIVRDEPTSGLDPLVQETFYELVSEVIGRGGTVFLSSHVLSEVQHVADRVGLIREGRLELVDTVDNLRGRAFTTVEATFAEPPPSEAFADLPGVRLLDQHGDVIRFGLEGDRPTPEGAGAISRPGARCPRGRPRGRLLARYRKGGAGCCVMSLSRACATSAEDSFGGAWD